MNDPTLYVPTLEELRDMDNLELMKLRSELTWAAASVEEQITASTGELPNFEDWERRARGARLAFQRGLSGVKNVLVERSAANKDARAIPLAPWLAKLNDVYVASSHLLDGNDEDDDAWDALADAVADVKDYMVTHEFAVGVQL